MSTADPPTMQPLRDACAAVAERARSVRLDTSAIAAYAASLPLGASDAAGPEPDPDVRAGAAGCEERAAFWLTLDAINFGSGWFPTLRRRPGRSGYHTIATGIRERVDAHGPWSADELEALDAAAIAAVLGQDPAHELMALFAVSLRDLGRRLNAEHDGRFTSLVDAAGGSAVALALRLGGWACYSDASRYDELELPFLKRAQIVAADLARAGVARFADLGGLTMFADNLVPHVLRLDGILSFDPDLVARIDREVPIEHGSREEVEIRACAVHAVELITAAWPHVTAAEVDDLLWNRGAAPFYKASPRHRSRCTAY